MSDASSQQEMVIKPKHGLIAVDFRELWQYRELFFFLAWRDIAVRYKQTLIGIFWAALQPLMTMVIFTVIFNKLAGLKAAGDTPYAVMTFAALLPWQFFANAMSQSSNSLVNSANMLRKVYFPRLIMPSSAVISGAVDFLIAALILMAMMLYYGVGVQLHILLLPLFFLMAVGCAFGIGLWFSALNVKYRDVKHVIPFIQRMGMYVCPIGFMSSVVRDNLSTPVYFLYNLNPMVGVIDGFRWAILGPAYEPYWPGFWASAAIVVLLIVSGAYFFRSVERTFADIV